MPVDILKKGLKVLQKKIQVKKDDLERQLHEKITISSQDEAWLDSDANFVTEIQVIEALETASNYERGLGRLDELQIAVVQRLHETTGDVAKIAGNKWKCLSVLSFILKCLTY